MPRTKGQPKTGGRTRGTPNKINGDLKHWIADILGSNRPEFERNLKKLEPPEFIRVYTALLNFVIPKQQASTPENQLELERRMLEQLIEDAPDEFVDKITERIKKLKKETDE